MLTSLILSSLLAAQAPQPTIVPFRVADNAIIVDAMVNGHKVSCLFDTGFSGSFVLGDNQNFGPSSGSMTLRDFVGEFQANTVNVKTLQIGSATVPTKDMQIVQQPMAHMSESYNMHTDGIMGIEVMKNFVLGINFEKKQFELYPKTADPIAAIKPDNKKTFVIKMLPIGANSVELPVTTPTGDVMVLALDTGNAFYATTHRDVLERVGMWTPNKKADFMRVAFVASGPVPSFDMQFDELNIWGVPVKGSTWSIIDLPSSSSDHDGTVGFGFLKNFNILIDQERRRVSLVNWSGKTADPPPAHVGLNAFFNAERNRYVVSFVTPGGPASAAGIQPGDSLLAINDQELLDVGFRKLQEMLEGEDGTAITLSISRGGELRKVELKRKTLVNHPPK